MILILNDLEDALERSHHKGCLLHLVLYIEEAARLGLEIVVREVNQLDASAADEEGELVVLERTKQSWLDDHQGAHLGFQMRIVDEQVGGAKHSTLAFIDLDWTDDDLPHSAIIIQSESGLGSEFSVKLVRAIVIKHHWAQIELCRFNHGATDTSSAKGSLVLVLVSLLESALAEVVLTSVDDVNRVLWLLVLD